MQKPPAGKPVVYAFPTPNLADRVMVVVKNSREAKYELPALGTPLENYPDFLFATAKPAAELDGGEWHRWFYVNERANQDAYNAEVSYPYGDTEYPQVTRTYVLLSDGMSEPNVGDADPGYADLVLVDHAEIPLEDPVLASLFTGVRRVYEAIPGPWIYDKPVDRDGVLVTVRKRKQWLDEIEPSASALANVEAVSIKESSLIAWEQETTFAEVFDEAGITVRQAGNIPDKFVTADGDITEEAVIEGAEAVPDPVGINGVGVVESSAKRISKTRVRKSKRTRTVSTEQAVVEKKVNTEGQVVTISGSLGALATLAPDALTEAASSQSLGGGLYLTEIATVPEVFGQLSYGVSREDLTPARFRAAVSQTAVEETVAGTAAMPELEDGEISATEQQVTVHKKRVRRVSRTSVGDTVLEGQKLVDGQVATVTETLYADGTTCPDIEPDPKLVQSEVDELGDGRKILTEVWVPQVFDARVESLQQAISIPAKFMQAGAVISSVAYTAPSEDVELPELGTLGVGVVSTRTQRVDATKTRVTVETLDGMTEVSDPINANGSESGEQFRDVAASIEESLSSGNLEAEVGSLVIASRVEPVGLGRQIRRTVRLPRFPQPIVLPGRRMIGIPARLYSISHYFYCHESPDFKVGTKYNMDSATSMACHTRTTIEFSDDANSDLQFTLQPATKDLRYDGYFFDISANNVLCNAISWSSPFHKGECNFTESYSFPATEISATSYAGRWYLLSQEVEPWGTSDYKITSVEFYVPQDSGDFPNFLIRD